MSRLAVLLSLVLIIPSPGVAADTPTVRLPANQAETPEGQRALQAMERFEADLEEIRALEPVARWERTGRLRGELERLVARCKDTRLENKARYLLASWHLEHGSSTACSTEIDTILASGNPGYRNLTIHLRGRLQLRLGLVAEARKDAEYIADRLPSMDPLLDLVRFHETVGRSAPRLIARNLGDGEDDPFSARREAWLLVCFVHLADAQERFIVARYLETLADEAFARRVRPILVSFDDDALGAITRMRELPGGAEDMDLLWLGPNDPLARERWRREWELPTLPVAALLGPDRSILAVEPGLDRLRILVGLKPQETQEAESSNAIDRRRQSGFGWKGRR